MAEIYLSSSPLLLKGLEQQRRGYPAEERVQALGITAYCSLTKTNQ